MPNDALGTLMILRLAGGHHAICTPDDEPMVRQAMHDVLRGSDAIITVTLASGAPYTMPASSVVGLSVEDEWQRRAYDAILDALNGEDVDDD